MRVLRHLLFLFVCFSQLSHGVSPPKSSIVRQDVKDIGSIAACAHHEGKGIFLIDADEVLFTSDIDKKTEKIKLLRLYEPLEVLIKKIKDRGHKVMILTYNHASSVKEKLKRILLSEALFDDILSCEMKGDLLTAKGELFKSFMEHSKEKFNFAVFIDNFPPFVENMENVAKEMGIPLYSFVSTGYRDMYYRYVYHYLTELQIDLKKDNNIGKKLERIQASLKKYNIDIARFKENYPNVEMFRKHVNDLIWPYLVYL